MATTEVLIGIVLGVFVIGIIGYSKLIKLLRSNSCNFTTAVSELRTTVIELKACEDNAVIQRLEMTKSLDDLTETIGALSEDVGDLTIKVDDLETKTGSDIEYYADSVLVKLTTLTPFNDLKLYLSRKRDIMVAEAKRLLLMGIEYTKPEIMHLAWENMRRALQDYANRVSPEFSDYNAHSTPLRDEELKKFENSLFHSIMYGNGSKEKIFIEQVKVYIKNQLEYTFKDYQDYRSTNALKRKEENNQTMKEYLHSLVRENNIEMVFYQIQQTISTKKSSELYNRLTLLMSQYHAYKKDEQLGIALDEVRNTYKSLCQSVISFIDTVCTL
jgi:hypothetical protein